MRNIIITIILLTLALSIQAQTESCKVLLEKISGKYTGGCKDGLADGKGKSIGEDTYIGLFKNGLPHGKGEYDYNNGDVFIGQWLNGHKDGKGKFTFTLNGKKNTMIGYWEKDDFIGSKGPDTSYRVTGSTGIMGYKVEKKAVVDEQDQEITFSIKSAFLDFLPSDLQIVKSSGQLVQTGKKISITNYFYPFHCEINYTILVLGSRKQCSFTLDVFDTGKYSVTLNND